MADYPDWTRLFYLVGTAITIPINIETSTVTLDVNLVGSDIDLNVNIAAAAVTLDINFLDQSVAVFDANQWYALQAAQIGLTGSANVTSGNTGYPASRTVPDGKIFFITGIAGVVRVDTNYLVELGLVIASIFVAYSGGRSGQSILFHTPMRATAGQLVQVAVFQASGSSQTCDASMWGYDRDA